MSLGKMQVLVKRRTRYTAMPYSEEWVDRAEIVTLSGYEWRWSST